MDNSRLGNQVTLCGNVTGRPAFSHCVAGRNFYTFPLTVSRLSGAEDTLNIVCDEALMQAVQPGDNTCLLVEGELRSHNNKTGIGNKLLIFVYALKLYFCTDEHKNDISLRGVICRKPNGRKTPLGREICDILLAINRPFGHSDYLPCICWGHNARQAARWEVGDVVELEGRLQSRNYIKYIDGLPTEKTAYEVSVSEINKEESCTVLTNEQSI